MKITLVTVDYLKGESFPSLEKLIAIVKAAGIDTQEIDGVLTCVKGGLAVHPRDPLSEQQSIIYWDGE
ncbi:hypothetical protein LCGC14_0343150 [marine sediment metagenome]|uniref:Uncharacterized protein n=1 Tax=marine sediment metagenome TaxID=412755 RepID=A0A0F9TVZ7_9ZZZZ